MFIHMNMLHSKTFEHRRSDSNPFQVVKIARVQVFPSHQCRVETKIADGSLELYILNNISQLFFPKKLQSIYIPQIYPNNISQQYIHIIVYPSNLSPHISQQYFPTIYPYHSISIKFIPTYFPTIFPNNISPQYIPTIYPHNPPNPSKSLNISRVTRHWTSLRKRMTS